MNSSAGIESAVEVPVLANQPKRYGGIGRFGFLLALVAIQAVQVIVIRNAEFESISVVMVTLFALIPLFAFVSNRLRNNAFMIEQDAKGKVTARQFPRIPGTPTHDEALKTITDQLPADSPFRQATLIPIRDSVK